MCVYNGKYYGPLFILINTKGNHNLWFNIQSVCQILGKVWYIIISSYLKTYLKNVKKNSLKKLKTKNHMGKIASSDLQLNGNFIFLGIWDNWADICFNLHSWSTTFHLRCCDITWYWRGRGPNPWTTVFQHVALTITPQTHTLLVTILFVSILFCIDNTHSGKGTACK